MVEELLALAADRPAGVDRFGLRTTVSAGSQWLRLNARVAGLALTGKWVTPREVARGYDRVAGTYNEAWQCRLRPVTDTFMARLPGGLAGTILDLGCGAGYTTAILAARNPEATIHGVDISAGMLKAAGPAGDSRVKFIQNDMLEYLQSAREGSARMVVSTWALGYSHPAKLIAECHRVLQAGGAFGFIVNYFDTLAPVFRAFQGCMLRFPERVQRAAWPRFPRTWASLESPLRRVGFRIDWHADGREKITPPEGSLLAWLKQTGILAGFDAMLELSGPAAKWFEAELRREAGNIYHHYAAVVAAKP